MFSAFNLNDITEESFCAGLFYSDGLKQLEEDKANIESDLKKYICNNNCLDGSLMQSTWFPSIDADIFLSHSHKDEKIVISFAGWLNKIFGLKVFIDSCVWGYSNDLIELLDKEYCNPVTDKCGSTTYNYELRNYTTSHVHMMLALALTKMIDKTESLFFFNTPNSILLSDSISHNSTLSPWIYCELEMARMIRRKKLEEYRLDKSLFSLAEQQINIKYDISFDGFSPINASDILWWWKHKNNPSHPLDTLYEYKNIIPKIIND